MTQEPLPQPPNHKAARSSSLQRSTTASPQVSPYLQKLISTQQQGEPQSRDSTKISPKQRIKLPQTWSLKVKSTTLALAVSVLPVLAVGTVSYLGSQSIHQQVSQARQAGARGVAETEIALQRQLLSLVVGTGVTAVLTGAIAAFLVNRAIRRVLNAAVASTTLVNKLQCEDVAPRDRVAGKDELVALETNISLIEAQLPDLLWKQEAEAERSQMLVNITRRLWESLSQADVLRTTVEEVRKAFKTDRVVIFRFETNWDGTFIEESVASGLPKMLWATIDTPLFEEKDLEKYRNGRVLTIDNIYQAGLTDSYIGLLERFAIKANLSAPIIKDNQLFGLLIAHQCSGARFWQQPEIDLFAHLAAQVGFALERARLLEQVETKAKQAQILIDINHRIRKSLNEDDILKTTVEEARKAIGTERVLVFGFDANWYGTVIAESVLPGFPKALWAQIKDPCFAEGYVEKYQAGRVQATKDIYAAGLTECHIKQLKAFAVKANLVAPILKDGHLFGLLIAHECSRTRDWQQWEINLFAQIATQVGFALDHARLLNQVEQAYQAASATSHEQRQQKEALQHQVTKMLRDNETSVKTLPSEAIAQMESVTAAYDRIQAVADTAQIIIATIQQAELQIQQAEQTVKTGHESVSQTVDGIVASREAILEVAGKINRLNQPTQKLPKVVDIISNVAYQLKLYAMNIKLATSRNTNAACQEFTAIAEKVLASVEQLDAEITQIKLLVAKIQAETQEAAIAIGIGTEQTITKTKLVEETQQKLNLIASFSVQMISLFEEIAQAATNQTPASTSASQAILEAASIASKTSQQSIAVAESFTKLAAVAQEL